MPYRYVPPQKVWFLRRYGLKTGIDLAYFGLEKGTDLAHFGLESVWVWISKKLRECMNLFVVSIPKLIIRKND